MRLLQVQFTLLAFYRRSFGFWFSSNRRNWRSLAGGGRLDAEQVFLSPLKRLSNFFAAGSSFWRSASHLCLSTLQGFFQAALNFRAVDISVFRVSVYSVQLPLNPLDPIFWVEISKPVDASTRLSHRFTGGSLPCFYTRLLRLLLGKNASCFLLTLRVFRSLTSRFESASFLLERTTLTSGINRSDRSTHDAAEDATYTSSGTYTLHWVNISTSFNGTDVRDQTAKPFFRRFLSSFTKTAQSATLEVARSGSDFSRRSSSASLVQLTRTAYTGCLSQLTSSNRLFNGRCARNHCGGADSDCGSLNGVELSLCQRLLSGF